ncbi:hypothetical protein Q9L58_008689 [Maublancomyces gigas]|uniref:Ankyrin repeat protein n=1 Tax=Discina gigas TaxID=1032678 RepID=A0ABR3G914_9PEZI
MHQLSTELIIIIGQQFSSSKDIYAFVQISANFYRIRHVLFRSLLASIDGPMTLALKNNDFRLAQIALENDPECLNRCIEDGGTPLHYAARYGLKTMVNFLLAKAANRHIKDGEDKTPLLVALPTEYSSIIVPILLQRQWNALPDTLLDQCFRTDAVDALACAARSDVVDQILACDVDINTADGMGKTALHHAVVSSFLSVGLLLDRGSQVDALDQYGRTPLFYSKSLQVTTFLLKRGASIGVIDHNGMTVLHYITDGLHSSEQVRIVEKLINTTGLNIFATDNTARTARGYAEHHLNHGILILFHRYAERRMKIVLGDW